MYSFVYWLAETPLIPVSPYTTYQIMEDCTDYQVTDMMMSDASQEFAQIECSQIPIDAKIVDTNCSDTDSDGVEVKMDSAEVALIPVAGQPHNLSDSSITDSGYSEYPSLLPLPLLHLPDSPSTSHSDYYSHQEESKPQVCLQGGDAKSLLGRPRCEVCHRNPCNTCLMHHTSRHTDLCYTCAASHFARGRACPLCHDNIVYIYMYDDV